MIIITNHARDRILQRMAILDKEVPGLVKSAFNSAEPKGKVLESCLRMDRPDKKYQYRKMDGYVYVFDIREGNAVLVTTYYYVKPMKKSIWKRKIVKNLHAIGHPVDNVGMEKARLADAWERKRRKD